MTYTTHLVLTLSTLSPAVADLGRQVRDLFDRHRALLEYDLLTFLTREVGPTAMLDLEHHLAGRLRELGRELVEWTCNRLEGDDPGAVPHHLRFDGEDYRLVQAKSHQQVDSLFGPFRLRRHLYRPVDRDSGERSIAPLARSLGVVENTTPALAAAAGRYLAEAGATQRVVQDRLRTQHGVTIGTARLRALAGHLSAELSAARQKFQVERVLDLLVQAGRSRGSRKPVLSVGRDGISLREHRHGLYEVASTATVTVFDRAGRRLGSVYLGFTPEHGQGRMTDRLTALVEAVLVRWEGPAPRLAYVTDAGENETQYYDRVLRGMLHPRTGVRLDWQRVVDFYHVMERVWVLSGALFGSGTPAARGWARKMGRVLKQPNGPFRVLHAAAAARSRRVLTPTEQDEYRRAYQYLRDRTPWMQYHTYRGQHLPLGSGITEAACKTIFTQRLKLSGMRWSKTGAQVILDLRVVLLSGIWDEAYRHVLTTYMENELRVPNQLADVPLQMAA